MTSFQLLTNLILPDDQPIRHATSEGLQEILRHLNIRKALGWDEIGNIALRKLRHFPADWKRADVILFTKPQKDPLFPQNYRPVSPLPSLGKVAEVQFSLRRLKEQEEDLHVIPDEQFGFRRTLSTELQVLRMTE